ncbi:Virulence factor mviN [Actinoplanes sp. SE50]|nr:Virulence factor mviN [Actinoplanes sp. SE50/110]ATO87649.1 Virulence factor mviN [Actinoplanes sp. SE50]SLM05068.1 lipid II flippase MurJ [Actinoplanes sp. SE50/110]
MNGGLYRGSDTARGDDGLYRSAHSAGLPPSADAVPPSPAGYSSMPADGSVAEPEVPEAPEAGGGGLLRSSAIMAIGTLASRVTGFLRTTLLVAALGSAALGDAFNTANTMPNIVYDILLGGVLTAAHVPLLIRARNRSAEYGEEFEQRLFTILLGLLALITAGAMIAAPWLIDLYASRFPPAQHRVASMFLLFFLPQIFFYGFSAVAGASLNSRGRFAAAMWTPVLNNVVVIGVLGAFMAVTHGKLTPDNITDGQVTYLGIGVTAGVAVQALGLIPAMHRMGFNWRLRFDFRRAELTQIWGMASWTLVYVLAQQVALLVYTNLANAAGAQGVKEGIRYGVGLTPWTNAYMFFQLPYAVVAISIITAILPKMTQSAAEGRFDRLVTELREGLGLSLTLMLPAVAVLFGAAGEICLVVFAHGKSSPADAAMVAGVLRVFAVALTPFAVLQLLQRGFYALGDTRTPAMIALGSTGVGGLTAFLLSRVLPTADVVLGIAGAQGVAWACGCVISVVVLRRRLGRLGGGALFRVISKAGLASLATLLVVFLIHHTVTPHLHDSFPLTAVVLAVEGVLGLGAFVIAATLLRVPEVGQVIGMVRRKLGR